MQNPSAKTVGPVTLTRARVEPAPIWVLVAGVVLLLLALGPSFVKPTSTSPVRPAAMISGAPARPNGR
jgi:hypothetical protein